MYELQELKEFFTYKSLALYNLIFFFYVFMVQGIIGQVYIGILPLTLYFMSHVTTWK